MEKMKKNGLKGIRTLDHRQGEGHEKRTDYHWGGYTSVNKTWIIKYILKRKFEFFKKLKNARISIFFFLKLWFRNFFISQ